MDTRTIAELADRCARILTPALSQGEREPRGRGNNAAGYGFEGLVDDSGLTPWRRISFSACRFKVDCCPMASRFTLSAHVGQIELVSTSRIPQIMHIFGLSAIHVSFTRP